MLVESLSNVLSYVVVVVVVVVFVVFVVVVVIFVVGKEENPTISDMLI